MKPYKLTFLLLTVLFNTSCLTVGMIERNCDKFAQVCVADSEVVHSIVYRDTTVIIHDTISVTLPADTVTICDTVTITKEGAQLKPVQKTNGIITTDAWVTNSILHINSWLNDSTILVPYADSVTVKTKNTTTVNTKYIELPPERFIPKFYKFTFWFFISILVAGVVFILLKLKLFPIDKIFSSVLEKLKL